MIIGIITAILTPFALAEPFLTELGVIIAILAATVVQALIYYAIGDLLLVVMDIEYNTSRTMKLQAGMPPEERRVA